MRAAAVRIAERYLGSADPSIVKAVLALAEDRNWNVRRQVAASIGELPASARKDPALAMLRKSGSDPIIVDAVVSGIAGAEEQVLGDLLHADAPQSCAVGGDRRTRGGNHAKWRRGSRSKVARAGHRRRTSRRRTIGRTSGDRQGSTGVRSGGRPRGPAGRKSCRSQHSRSRRSVHSGTAGDVGRRAHRVGSPRLRLGAACAPSRSGREQVGLAEPAGSGRHRLRLSPAQQKQFAAGAEIYKGLCVGCHQEDGKGKDKVGASLVDSAFVKNADPNAVIRVLLSGKEGTIGLMPPVGATYDDEQIAAVLTFVRRSWGNAAPPVDSLSVLEYAA